MIHTELWYREAGIEDELARLQRGLAEGQVSPLEFAQKWDRAKPGSIPPLSIEQLLELPEDMQPEVEVTENYSSQPESLSGEELGEKKFHADPEETLTLKAFLAKWYRHWDGIFNKGPYPALFKGALILDAWPEDDGSPYFYDMGGSDEEEEEWNSEYDYWAYRNENWLEIKAPSKDFLRNLATYFGVEELSE